MDRWRSLLDEMAALEGEDRSRFAWTHPELLAASVQDWLKDHLAAGESSASTTALEELRLRREALESRREDFVFGSGPVELLWSRVRSGELSQSSARELARDAWEAALADAYVDAIRSVAGRMMEAGNADQAVLILQLLLEALDARPAGRTGDEAGRHACLRYVAAAQRHLRNLADGRVFRDADEAGRQVLAWAEAEADIETEADALSALGLLYLEPYSAGRRSTNIEHELYRWQRHFAEQAGAELRGVAAEEWSMPVATEALSTAFDLLVAASGKLTGVDRGATLKQAAQAALFNEALGEPLDHDRVVGILEAALEEIDIWEEPDDHLSVLNFLHGLGLEPDGEGVERLLERSADEWVHRLGPLRTLDVLRQAARFLRQAQPRRAQECLRGARALVAVIGDENVRVELWMDELNAIFWTSPAAGDGHDPPGETGAAAAALRSRAAGEGWDASQLAGALLRLIATSPTVDGEAAALLLLDEVEEEAPVLAAEYRDQLAFQRAMLQMNLGVNAFTAGDFDAALRKYLEALQGYMNLEVSARALDVLSRIEDLAQRSSEAGVIDVVAGLIGLALPLETTLGEPATRFLRQIYKHAFARMIGDAINPEALVLLSQMAKGMRFGVQLGSEAAFSWQEDEEGRELLAEIATLEEGLSADASSGQVVAGIDEGLLLTPYSGDVDARSGNDTTDRLANLRRSYDRRLHDRLLINPEAPSLLTQQTIQGSLDYRTVLLSPYLGVTAAGNMAVITIVATADDVRLVGVDLTVADGPVELTDRGRTFESSSFALLIQEIRKELRSAPDPFPLTSRAAELLATTEPWFGGLFPSLDELRGEGKDHLCIVPHGPLHAFPFHLLHYDDAPLAERWAVSYLPNTRLLLSRPGPPTARTARRSRAAVLALDYDGGSPHRLAPLPQARDEATAIAAAYGVDAMLNEQVTESAVKDALGRARVVHIAAHGRHDVEAPAFQCLYVTPEEGSDGRLSAHELLAQDMRATEIVTLSACETALGRFDLADNPRGLPATFLLAGVSTVVGTLWPVETNSSACFFTAFHAGLAAGTPRLEAFAEAQRATRSRFPAYRDWGAFHFVGDWLEPAGSTV